MTLEELYVAHRADAVSVSHIECACGIEFEDDMIEGWHASSQHLAHINVMESQWLKGNGFGNPSMRLPVNICCQVCGAMIGLPDEHRKVCANG